MLAVILVLYSFPVYNGSDNTSMITISNRTRMYVNIIRITLTVVLLVSKNWKYAQIVYEIEINIHVALVVIFME